MENTSNKMRRDNMMKEYCRRYIFKACCVNNVYHSEVSATKMRIKERQTKRNYDNKKKCMQVERKENLNDEIETTSTHP
jgi:hypothetical protein